jgi:GMP synthase (glutamine-hydrolysing)
VSTAPRILVVQHEEQCPPAWVGMWLAEAGCALDVRRPDLGESLPEDLSGHDGLLVLGGHMGANDDAEFPWLGGVKALVREAAVGGVPTLGICLGHQLVAVALGGSVTVNPLGQQLGVLEIGWSDKLLGERPRRGIQWNNDIVDRLPDGAVALARTERGELQAARFAGSVWGVQLHPEADVAVVTPWADADRATQGDALIDAALAEVATAVPEMHQEWEPVARRFAQAVAGSAGP